MIIEFNEDLHQYSVDGRVLPSVTQIIKSAGLINDFGFSEEAAERGRNVHLACQLLDEDDLEWDSLEAEYVPYVQAYERFLKDCEPRWELMEEKVADINYGYAGRLDRLGRRGNSELILDIKTGSMPKWCGIQLAAYIGAIEYRSLPARIKRYGLQLNNDGTYKLHQYKDKNDIKIFRAALAVHNWKLNYGG